MRSAPSRRCGNSCGARRSGWWAPTSGATPTRTYRADFEDRRVEHYAALRKPLDPTEFIDPLRERDARRTGRLARGAAQVLAGWRSPTAAAGPIKLTPLTPRRSHATCAGSRAEVRTRWGAVPLIDILKEAVLRTGCLRAVTSVAGRGALPEDVLAERLLLAIYGYGTNTGIRAVRRRRARAQRGRHPVCAAPLPDRRGGPADRDRDRQRHLRRPPHDDLGCRLDRRRVGLDAFRRVRSEHLHRVALPLRRPRRAHLLARREGVGGHPLPAAQLLRLRGRTRWSMAPSATAPTMAVEANYVDYPRPVGDRVRHHRGCSGSICCRGSSGSTR